MKLNNNEIIYTANSIGAEGAKSLGDNIKSLTNLQTLNLSSKFKFVS